MKNTQYVVGLAEDLREELESLYATLNVLYSIMNDDDGDNDDPTAKARLAEQIAQVSESVARTGFVIEMLKHEHVNATHLADYYRS